MYTEFVIYGFFGGVKALLVVGAVFLIFQFLLGIIKVSLRPNSHDDDD